MKISGFQKLTLLDYPGVMACIVFTQGCNLRCPFCHNWPLVINNDSKEKKAEMNSIIVNIQNSYKYLEQSHPSSKELKKKVKNKVKIINDNFADKLNNYNAIVKMLEEKNEKRNQVVFERESNSYELF